MIYLPNNSILKVHDLFDPLPAFMREADVIFTDIPYNQSLLTNYTNRSEAQVSWRNTGKFGDFLSRFFECVRKIGPETLFVETGKVALAEVIFRSRKDFKYVTFYNATYYHNAANKSYIIHATNNSKRRRYTELEDLDEEDAIAWICAHHSYTCIGDLCMGKGLVGKYAYLAGRRFVGIDFNSARLQVLVDFIEQKEQNGKTPRSNVG